jgi:hypothetical protein
MLNSVIDSLETKLYAVHDDLTYREVDSLENGFKARPTPYFAILKENVGRTESLFNGDFFAHSKYTFYDAALNQTKIIISDWSLLKVIESRTRNREVIYSISDPEGEIRDITNLTLNKGDWSAYFQIDGICKIVKMLREISIYPNWTYYDLKKENDISRLKIDELNLKVKELTERLNELEQNNTAI